MSDFATDIAEGLSSDPKFLSSKYFYDDEGSRLFQQIMDLPEYYVTRAEQEIFSTQTAEICEALGKQNTPFDLIELGPGDGTKTAFLIRHLLETGADFNYVPIDISREAIDILTKTFEESFPALSLKSRTGDYFQILEELKSLNGRRKIILFLGSSIGNFLPGEQEIFFSKLENAMSKDDSFLIGFDLQKDPQTILRAYDDSAGITGKFNLNLLERINRELGGNFVLPDFSHYAVYLPVEGAAKSYLISRENQTVFIEAIGQEFAFEKWEPIFMEVSQKYSLPMIDELARKSSFKVERNFLDSKRFFTNSLWTRI